MPAPAQERAPFRRTDKRESVDTGTAETAAEGVGGSPPGRRTRRFGVLNPAIADSERYLFGEVFAAGGIGVVRRGEDRRLGRVVAIKELQHSNPQAQQRFALEAAITARLQHPGIVPLYDLGWKSADEPYYCMKLVDGESLEAKIRQAGDLSQRLRLIEHVIAVADAIAYAHSQQIIHRDLKPANVLIGRFGETVVIDWGLAKDLSGEITAELLDLAGPARSGSDDQGMTEAGTVMGTLRYMPPEQAAGKAVDERSDVYALGAILYHVLTGQPPFAHMQRAVALIHVIEGQIAAVRALAPTAPRELAAIAHRALAREPSDRYASAAAFAEDLRRFQTGRLVSAHSYSLREAARLWFRRHRVKITVVFVLLLSLQVSLYAFIFLSQMDDADTMVEESEAARAKAEEELADLRAACTGAGTRPPATTSE